MVIVGSLLFACWYFGICSYADVAAYRAMSRQCHPVWKDLAIKRVHAQQSVDEVIEMTSPYYILRYGVYTDLLYMPKPSGESCEYGLIIFGKNNRIVAAKAWGWDWEHSFFDEISKDEWLDREYTSDALRADYLELRRATELLSVYSK